MPALALTDNGNLYGALEFYKECRKQNIKPIIGVDTYVALRSRHDKEARIDNSRSRLVLLARNENGYKNLLKLVTKSYLEGFYYKPRVDKELLEQYCGGLIAVIPSFSGETSVSLKNKNGDEAQEKVKWYQHVFGEENVFLEITYHPEIEGHSKLMEEIKQLASDTGTTLVASHDVYYLRPEDREARETLVKIQTGAPDQESWNSTKEDFSFISQKTAEKYFADIPEALANTLEIADRCNLDLELGKWVFPDFKVESGRSYDEELRHIVYANLPKKGFEKNSEVTERLWHELSVITSRGFAPYFLVVADLMQFAHERNILTTVRGSVAGSLVAYLAGITNVDPIGYKLPFERFLYPDRPGAPDIDMDFADNRRDEVIQYAREKYGEDKVAQIGTFGTMMARAAVRDVARALGHPYGLGDRIARLIPFGSQGFPMTIDRAMDITPELKGAYEKEKDVRQIIDLAKKIEGCARHISVHAAGVVIAPEPLTEYVPLQFDPKGGKLITQYDMHAVEDAGLLKFDFLGIRNLAILADAVGRANKKYGTDIDIENIPLNDKKTFELLSKGETMGLFQLNGQGITKYLKDLKPTTIHDINAMVALYRPGPMESIPSYIERKHNPALVTHLDPRMKDILSQSYGVITYQEDVLLIAVELAGYSWLEADKLRKAMGKKIPAEMEAQKEKLKDGLVKNGMSKEKAERLWKLIEPFAAYGFNRAHAASYGKVAYQTAYMKANFPVEYMAAVLTADSGDVEKVSDAITECARMGIPVLPPDINGSFGDFTVTYGDKGNTIRFGLFSIKNLGEGIAESIIEEREQNGKFKSLADFLQRIHDRNLNRKSLESLIKCGALDSLEGRGAMLANIEKLLAYNKEYRELMTSQESLFSALPEESRASEITLSETEPIRQEEKLAWEKELLGLYISGHPLDRFREKLAKHKTDIRHVKEEVREGMPAVIYGIVEESKPILTKNGGQMAFLRIADFSGTMEVVVFPRLFDENRKLFVPEKCIGVKGRVSGRGGELSLVAEAVKEL
jgi:DNA polymerase-3 subunit alpha